jgi:alanyl-tRNA synthetase
LTPSGTEMTEKIFRRDAYCREITARISGKERRENQFLVRLDRTIFCPEGGGQPADSGTINGLPLLALEADHEDIVHVLAQDPGEGEACLQLDFPRRYDHMQQHTAQHLLSQVLLRLFAAPTLSFAIGPEHASIEIGRADFGEEEAKALEAECARLVFANLAVRIFESDDPSALHLRKPPKVEGMIRVVEIDGFDQSACGGTHLKSSAEIGLLKIVRTERVRANIRLYYTAGYRSLKDYQLKHGVAQRLQRLVTQPLAEIPAQVECLLQERDELRRALKKVQRRELEQEIAGETAGSSPLVVREFSGLDPAELRFFVAALIKAGKHALVFQRSQPAYIIIGRGPGDFDLRSINARIFALLNGKGGGSANLVEGRAEDFSRINEVADLLRASLPQPGRPPGA